jgi:hypothetical protein
MQRSGRSSEGSCPDALLPWSVARRHQCFALRDVRFAGVHLPGATMDCWEDDEGRAHWSARVVMRLGLVLDEGELAGRTSMDES